MTNLKILTYNVYHKTIKIEDFFNKFKRDIKSIVKKNRKLDVVGIQENVDCDVMHGVPEFSRMRMINCQIGKTPILTFLNPDIKVLGFAWDSFYYERKKGRPFHIIVAEYQGQDFMFINCHFPHINQGDIEKTIIEKLTFTLTCKYCGYIIPDKDMGNTKFDVTPHYNTKTNKTEYTKLNGIRFEPVSIQPLLEKKDFHVVMLGDFNDHNTIFLHRGFIPFNTRINRDLKNNPNYNNLNTKLSCGAKPPVSCCIEETQYSRKGGFVKWKQRTMGDYIMVNKKFKVIRENEVAIQYKGSMKDSEKPYPPKEIASDHLPVIMEVTFQEKTVPKKKPEPQKKPESLIPAKSQFDCRIEPYKIKRVR